MMNGTSTYGGHSTTYSFAVRLGCDRKGLALNMRRLWNNWSIQLFALVGFMFQIVLALLGNCRRISSAHTTRFIIWASHLLTSYFATLALSKLTSASRNKSKEEYDTELKALLAPLVLLQLGNPAYSVEDYRLSVRSGLDIVITFSFVVWILGRCWKTSIRMILFFPMLVAGTIKYGETIWALKSVYDKNVNMKPADFFKEPEMPFALRNSSTVVPYMVIFLMARYRFDCLKLRFVEWLKHPYFRLNRSHSIGECSPADVILMTEMELGFMYDVLYTNAPVLYTKPGITLRFIGYFSLLLTLGGFMGVFSDQLLRDPYVVYTFGLLIGVVLLETYQFLKIFYSDWMLIMIIKHHIMVPKFLVKRSLKNERWSNKIWQFNFPDFCLSEKRAWHFKILEPFGKAEKFKNKWLRKSVQIHEHVKELVVEHMLKFETKRDHQHFTERDQWTLGIHESLDKLEWGIKMTFDRSIVIWHIATPIRYYSCHEKSDHREASKLICDYMMFLLVQHPQILSSTPAGNTYHHTYTNLKTFFDKFPEKDVLQILLGHDPVQECNYFQAVITKWWNVPEEARTLTRELRSRKDTWELISSVWAEMLCFRAYNCQQYHHVKMPRRGREIITHVWFLLHNTDESHIKRFIEIQ